MNKKSFFGIIAIATTMSGAMVVSSCSHDDFYYSEEKVEQNLNDKYAAAFEKAFGKVGSDVDWGFSSKKTNARALTRAGGGITQPNIDFPKDCEASKFLDDVPSGVEKLPADQDEVNGGTYYIDATTKKVKMNNIGTIYVKGTVDLSSSDQFEIASSSTEIYLVEGSTLKLGTNSAIDFKGIIYIAKDAQLETAGLLKVNGVSGVYNHGTISVGTFEVNTTGFLYNVGNLVTTGSVNVESNYSRIVNDGTINSASVQVKGGSLQNNAKWTVTGTTVVTSNSSGWINNGTWKTQNYAYTGGSDNVINNCYLEVANDFDMNLSSKVGSFKIDTDGGVVTKYFNGGKGTINGVTSTSGPYRIVMGQGVVFKVTDTATLAGGWSGWGFFGPSEGEYAVFQAKDIVRAAGHETDQGAVTYGGNLYVSAETHFPQGNTGAATQKYIFEQDNFNIKTNIFAAGEDFNSGIPNITIPKTICNPGFKGGIPLYRVIAEDLSAEEAGDFDFNDVVFDVVKAENQKTTLRLICAGGTLPLRVRGANEAKGVEVHSVYGETTPNAQGRYQMFNTGSGPTVPETEFTVEGEYTTPEKIKEIIIEVMKDNKWWPLNATKGKAACKILVDDTFVPVRERRNIADENKNFTNYVQGKFVDGFWWK